MSAARKNFLPLALGTFCFSAAAALTIPDIKVGDAAAQDISTPVKLSVVNAVETKSLRDAVRVPAVYRFNPMVAIQTEATLFSMLDRKREEFHDRVEVVFKSRSIKAPQVPFVRTQKLIGNFLRQNKNLPLTTNLLELWAQDLPDTQVRSAFAAKLRAVSEHYIRAEVFPAEPKTGSQAKMVSTTNLTAALSEDYIQQYSVTVRKTNVWMLSSARAELVKFFSVEERFFAKSLGALLRANSFFDRDMTVAMRDKKANALWSSDNYEPGQLIVKRGQVVDVKTMAALDELREKSKTVQSQVASAQPIHDNRWLSAAISAVVILSLALFFLATKRKRHANTLAMQLARGNPGDMMVACPSCDEKIIVPIGAIAEFSSSDEKAVTVWKQRALVAEARAETAAQSARNGVISEVAKLLKDKFVTKVVSHRAELLDTQERAAAEMAGLEARLREVNAPLQERLAAYEERIVELEKELTVRGEENRELIKAKIQIAKTQSAIAQAKSRMDLN